MYTAAGEDFQVPDWTVTDVKHVPAQASGSDCGVSAIVSLGSQAICLLKVIDTEDMMT